jgi:hypothetical protein
MELLLKTFSLSNDEFELHNKQSTCHVRSYFDNTMDIKARSLFEYLDNIDHSLNEYCEFGADKCRIYNFKDFCINLDIDIAENLSRIIEEYYYIFENNTQILKSPDSFYHTLKENKHYHFYNKNKDFMFTCTSPLYMKGYLAYFGCTGSQKYVIKAFEMIYKDGNYDLCYGARDYV